jgi:hypothetical protein
MLSCGPKLRFTQNLAGNPLEQRRAAEENPKRRIGSTDSILNITTSRFPSP